MTTGLAKQNTSVTVEGSSSLDGHGYWAHGSVMRWSRSPMLGPALSRSLMGLTYSVIPNAADKLEFVCAPPPQGKDWSIRSVYLLRAGHCCRSCRSGPTSPPA